MLSLRQFTGKQLVSFLRQDDFAHAGEKEAIDLVMSKFKKQPTRRILDAGCGLGGTAHYIQNQQWGTVIGVDIEAESIKYAIEHYPSVDFHVSDVKYVDKIFSNKAPFDIICLFNSFYAFSEQPASLKALNNIAKTSASLVIFDYSIVSLNNQNSFYRESSERNTLFKPIIISTVANTLKSSNWIMHECRDITNKYITWYRDLINKLEKNQSEIITRFGIQAYNKAYITYTDIYHGLIENNLGGAIIYAEKFS